MARIQLEQFSDMKDFEIGTVVIYCSNNYMGCGVVIKHSPKQISILKSAQLYTNMYFSTVSRYTEDCIYASPNHVKDMRELQEVVDTYNKEKKRNITIKFK